jgi:hypothetical protein
MKHSAGFDDAQEFAFFSPQQLSTHYYNFVLTFTFWICSVARSDSPKSESASVGGTTGAGISPPGTLCNFSHSGVSPTVRFDASSSSSSHKSLSCYMFWRGGEGDGER